jgi:hypothetical protein
MLNKISRLLDWLSDFFAGRKGLLPIVGILLVILNFILQFFPNLGMVVSSNFFLHLGIIVSVFGFMLAWAL